MLINTLLGFLAAAALVFIYKKYKSDDEKFPIAKLIGYYLLGGFRLNLNNLALPIGFIIYLAFFRPKFNKVMKKAAALVGLIIFICGLIIPAAQEAYFERERNVPASSSNIYDIDLNKDHDEIKKKLHITSSTKIENFNASFQESGVIKELRYDFLTEDNGEIVLYKVYYSSYENNYSIRPRKIGQWLQYDRLITDDLFFYALTKLGLKETKPQGEYEFYSLWCNGDYVNWGVKDRDNFLIQKNGLKKLKNEELPVKGYAFLIFGYEKSGESSYSAEDHTAYFLPVTK